MTALTEQRRAPRTTRGRFGEARLVQPRRSWAERSVFRTLGVADPAHYLRHRILDRAIARCAPGTVTRVLDAGCGPGDHTLYLARRYPQAEVIGVDIDAERIDACTRSAQLLGVPNVRFARADLSRLGEEVRSQPFDLIVSIDVLEHLDDGPGVIRTLADMLAPGGVLFIHIPTVRPKPVPFSRYLTDFAAWVEREHVGRELTAEEVREAVTSTGLTICHAEQTFGYWTGELATSLFAMPFKNTPRNRVAQVCLAPVCRLLALGDGLPGQTVRYAVAYAARR
jgi:2-polyprenyl-3-methyl-5-hydroxy-6-metoxy-1,4-benzoquinol methylase